MSVSPLVIRSRIMSTPVHGNPGQQTGSVPYPARSHGLADSVSPAVHAITLGMPYAGNTSSIPQSFPILEELQLPCTANSAVWAEDPSNASRQPAPPSLGWMPSSLH